MNLQTLSFHKFKSTDKMDVFVFGLESEKSHVKKEMSKIFLSLGKIWKSKKKSAIIE